MTWEPLLVGGDADRAIELVRRMTVAICRVPPVEDPALIGAAGITLFLAYAESLGVTDGQAAEYFLEMSLRACLREPLHIGLWTGGAGVRWLLDHLTDRVETYSMISRLDDTIIATLANSTNQIEFDLYSGVAGVALAYADDRTSTGERVVKLVLDRLELVDWEAQRNPGSAHGIAGVIAALTRCMASGICASRARQLLKVLIQRERAIELDPTRIGWCRGEAGVAPVLLAAARALGESQLEQTALDLALACHQRHHSWPSSAIFCHGTTGLAHACNRMYQATGNAELKARACEWMQRTMAILQEDGRDEASTRLVSHATSTANPTLLVGASGIAMTLLAGTTSLEPRWDRLFGMDV